MISFLKKIFAVCLAVILTKNVYTPVLVEADRTSPLRSTFAAETANR